MSPRTITLTGARGGHGTTTTAAALALYAAGHVPTALVSRDPVATAALIGVPLPVFDEWVQVTPALVLTPDPTVTGDLRPEIVVIDAGPGPSATEPAARGEHYVVLRGPCYVAVATVLAAPPRHVDGIILVAEPKRSLTARDVTEVLDLPVVATVNASPDVARTIDAGLLVARLHRLRDLAPLRALATDPYAGRPRPSTARPRQRTANGSQTHTDLPLSQSDNGAERSRAVNVVAISAGGGHVDGSCRPGAGTPSAEHRPVGPRCRRLLHRRGRHLGRGLLHRPW
ncbi:MAG: hypothetical protein ACR2KK_10345 [Acidimicrobiales bacterium]